MVTGIADSEGGVDWLHTRGNLEADMVSEDMGFKAFIDSFDCMIIGRKCMQTIARMNLTPEQWPCGDMRIIVLSSTIIAVPESLPVNVEMYTGDINALLSKLELDGLTHAYIDGGATITAFLNLSLIEEMIITKAPVILGAGIPLFGQIEVPVKLQKAQAMVYNNDFIQRRYQVNYT